LRDIEIDFNNFNNLNSNDEAKKQIVENINNMLIEDYYSYVLAALRMIYSNIDDSDEFIAIYQMTYSCVENGYKYALEILGVENSNNSNVNEVTSTTRVYAKLYLFAILSGRMDIFLEHIHIKSDTGVVTDTLFEEVNKEYPQNGFIKKLSDLSFPTFKF